MCTANVLDTIPGNFAATGTLFPKNLDLGGWSSDQIYSNIRNLIGGSQIRPGQTCVPWITMVYTKSTKYVLPKMGQLWIVYDFHQVSPVVFSQKSRFLVAEKSVRTPLGSNGSSPTHRPGSMGDPQELDGLQWENPIKMDDPGVPPILGHLHILDMFGYVWLVKFSFVGQSQFAHV